MTRAEFSNEFDILYNNITSNQAPGLDEYEKSVFLTNAQTEVIKSYFSPRENKVQQGFDMSRKRQIDFSALMKVATLTKIKPTNKFDSRSVAYRVPDDLLLFVNESCKDKNYRYTVIPISFEEYDRVMLKPYQYPVKKGIWRLLTDNTEGMTPSISTLSNSGATITINNSSDKTVIFTINFDSITNDTQEGTVEVAGVGRQPIITEDKGHVNIVFTINKGIDDITNIAQYFDQFIKGQSVEETLKLYLGDPGNLLNEIENYFGKNKKSAISITAKPAEVKGCITELIGRVDENSLDYTIRYIRRPKPIILVNLGELSIQQESNATDCELDESLHLEILQRAVESAQAAYMGTPQDQIALGQVSRTDIGIVSQSKQ